LDKDVLLDFLKEEKRDFSNGTAHTRWATHGGVCLENAHPHRDTLQGQLTIVHNGIIENFEENKRFLLEKNVGFRSSTDSEVIINKIAYHFYRGTEETDPQKRLLRSIALTTSALEGTYGIIVQCLLLPGILFCARKGSPILMGVSDDKTLGMVVSEKSGFMNHVREYISLNDNSLYCLENKDGCVRCYCAGDYCGATLFLNDWVPEEASHAYASFTEKEIMEQPSSIRRCLHYGSRLTGSGRVKLGGLERVPSLRDCRRFYLFGCGTSYHAALLGARFFRRFANAPLAMAFDASEFSTADLPHPDTGSRACALFISQSGETLDLYSVLEKLSIDVKLGVVNAVDSLIARNTDGGVYMNCGKEKGVASTKSFTSSVIALWLIARWFSDEPIEDIAVYSGFGDVVERFLATNWDRLHGLAMTFFSSTSSMFVLGKGADLFIAMEACLKLKELAYVHAEAYSSGSLKHGPFALLEEGTPVIFLATDPDGFQKTRNALHEVAARGARVIVVGTSSFEFDKTLGVDFIEVPTHPWSFLLANIAMQVFALHLAAVRGNQPDYPRNLAKVVTVE
jgi:glucosamine--fructose-6-phosphate aminotransferase (isomerizing)